MKQLLFETLGSAQMLRIDFQSFSGKHFYLFVQYFWRDLVR